ncbi:mitochondrial distribution and morphology protein family 31/32 [Microthyrium microscopicum]|uniref:Mitochondrial distribution and morphology protein family 31/32 n=1 Tax=Microthyrium microscopicum TaxID=703497 RepID=A0A6A6U1N7_9PEZI|nr:mitochondrial distribution and morphology protein family 31/32 [Microthyrium microscopicum]
MRNKSSVSQGGKSSGPGPSKPIASTQIKPLTENVKTTTKTTASAPILERLSHIHRPTKEELLAAASGFWSRLGVRFKWFSIRSVRPYSMDEILGFASWIFLGHFVWLIIGTTTFFSLVVFFINTVIAQEALGKWIGSYLTKSSGLQVVFESAIVPKWNDGVLSFGNVFVSRRPGQGQAKVQKGSQAQAAAAANVERPEEVISTKDDGNYTQFDVTIDTVNVTLSFAKWFNGKGLLQNVEVKGIRGVIDRTHVQDATEYIDPKSYKHEHNTGDFELDSFKMEDVLVTIYQPHDFRPFQISIFACDMPRLRQQWLFYDFMSANNISGSIDNSLFTLHPRQMQNYTDAKLGTITSEGDRDWKKQSRLRIDGLNIDHLNRGVEGPFSWIREGNVDIIADVMFPNEDDESVAKVLSDVIDRVEATVTTNSIPPIKKPEPEPNALQAMQSISEGGSPVPDQLIPAQPQEDGRHLVMDIKVHLNGVRAAVPLFTKDISYVNNALIRPIVAYINTQRTFIPINMRVIKERDEFDGSWTLFDSGLLDDLNKEVYEAFVRDVLENVHARRRRIKKVGIWTLQLAAQALFVGMAGNFA